MGMLKSWVGDGRSEGISSYDGEGRGSEHLGGREAWHRHREDDDGSGGMGKDSDVMSKVPASWDGDGWLNRDDNHENDGNDVWTGEEQ